MAGPGEPCGKTGAPVSSQGIDLRLGEEQGSGEVGARDGGVTQIGAKQVRVGEVDAAQVGGDQERTPEVRAT